jgi:hypothetical protein
VVTSVTGAPVRRHRVCTALLEGVLEESGHPGAHVQIPGTPGPAIILNNAFDIGHCLKNTRVTRRWPPLCSLLRWLLRTGASRLQLVLPAP